MEIGAQFYTVREQCQNLEGFAETLKKVADIGYRNVQISGTCPYPAQWLKEQLDLNGLKCVLTHIPVPRLTGELDQVIADHEVFGCDHIGLGWWAFDPEKNMSYEQWMEIFPPIARKIHEAGRLFMYHNRSGVQKAGRQTDHRAPDGGGSRGADGLHPGHLLGSGRRRRSGPVA